MTKWSSGYVSDIHYTYGFYRELTSNLLGLATLVSAGVDWHQPQSVVCELGCGQGFSANLLSAANPGVETHAVDFNPAQIAGARALATEAGITNVVFHEVGFADLSINAELPRHFDLIALHGVWSWISAENRHTLVTFIRERLKPGGLVYVSYNALPGWAATMPLRRLFVDHAGTVGGPLLPRIEQALTFTKRVLDANPAYLRANPGMADRFEQIRAQNRNYLAHEYFNLDWTPFYHADVAAEMANAKLTYVGPAHLLDGTDAAHLTMDQRGFLADIADPMLRETVRDYMINQQFRRDIFVKGAVPLSPIDVRERWLDTRFALSIRRADVPLKIMGTLGEVSLQPDVYSPLLDALAEGPRTLRQMVADRLIADLGWARVIQALTVLVGSGHVQPALNAKGDAERMRRTRPFNTVVMEKAKSTADFQYLASPVTGGGIAVDRFQQLFMLARQLKQPDPVLFAWNALNEVGQKLIKEGKMLETVEENHAELRIRLSNFMEKQLPVLQQLGIA
jgi:SAM-dependent methyltransferase